jgi:glucose/arabinose dehydrogenase
MRHCAIVLAFVFFLPNQPLNGGVGLATELIAEGLPEILAIAHDPADFERLFLVQRSGRIWIVKNGRLLETPFFDIAGQVDVGGERGMLGMAFHPDFQENRLFYVRYNDDAGDTVIVQYAVSLTDPDLADLDSAAPVISIPNRSHNHNGGWIEFGPDDFLYVSVGNDTDSDASQDINDLHGSILRIDVKPDDFPEDDLRNYGIPSNNPFVGIDGADEVWAWGLRNPWQCAIDHVAQRIWISDVGDFDYEEISVQPLAPAQSLRNFGYACMEGLHCTPDPICDCEDPELIHPVFEYSHSDGCAVVGGRVYRGCAIPELAGTYFCADYCSGKIWSMTLFDGGVTDVAERQDELIGPDGQPINTITSFGEDAWGELYICSMSGSLYKIVSATPQIDSDSDGVPDSCEPQLPADLTGDGVVDVDDLLLVINTWGPCPVKAPCIADLVVDGLVDVDDLLVIINNWTAEP